VLQLVRRLVLVGLEVLRPGRPAAVSDQMICRLAAKEAALLPGRLALVGLEVLRLVLFARRLVLVYALQ
jgi:hypothetical protein